MSALLNLKNVHAYYGAAHILHGLDLHVNPGERVALIGRNGVGKTTVVNTILGLASLQDGHVAFGGKEHTKLRAYMAAQHGIAVIPQGRRIVANLSVEENLILGGQIGRPGPWGLQRLYDLFPILHEKRHQPATSLSGGQQQMVAIGRALMSNPDLVLFDELSLGLAPIVIKDIYAQLPKITGQGMSAILVEQDVTRALNAANQFLCLVEGRLSLSGKPQDHSRDAISAAYFGT